MATVRNSATNWRRYGGGGLLIGGILWLLSLLLGGAAAGWLLIAAFAVIGIALFFVAFGRSGDSGAVGKSTVGKIALAVYGIGWIVLALAAIVTLPSLTTTIAGILIIVGGLVGAWYVYTKRIAKGTARWILFLPAVWGVLHFAGSLVGVTISPAWLVPVVLAALIALTGFIYLVNRRAAA